jgi:hypothetical protein
VWDHNGAANARGIVAGDALGATGGGCSRWIKAPSWQVHVGGYHKTGCDKHRLAADIAADADPDTGFDIFSGYQCPGFPTDCWATFGGTSLSAPIIAAMWALAGGSGGVRYPAASLYGHARSRFFDVTAGGNSWCGGLAHKKCARRTGRLTHASKNPNFLSLRGRNLGTLDCGFKRHTKKTTHVKTDHQCNAVTGYDGPTGRGTPRGLTVFHPVPAT